MRKLKVVVCLTTSLVALMFSPAVRAAQKSDWGAVKQLSEGQQIRIVLNDGKSYGGKFRSANDEAISAHLNGEIKLSIDRASGAFPRKVSGIEVETR